MVTYTECSHCSPSPWSTQVSILCCRCSVTPWGPPFSFDSGNYQLMILPCSKGGKLVVLIFSFLSMILLEPISF